MTTTSNSSSWTPAAVEELIFRQFLKGEDVSQAMPLHVDQHKLPDHDPCVKALFKYVDNGPTPVTRGGAGGGGVSNTPMKTGPQRSIANGAAHLAMPGTPRTGAGGGGGATGGARDGKSMPRTPRTKNDDGSSSAMHAPAAVTHHDQMKRRRVEWPASVPTDSQLKGAQRSALQPITEKRIAAQAEVDPDLIFRQETAEFPLTAIFARYPSALKLISQTRGLSGDWRNDTFTAEEEVQYKNDMGYTALGPSQAQPFSGQPVRLFQ